MFRKILVPLDLQDIKGSERTLKRISDYADENAEIHLMSVLPGFQMPMVASYFPKEAMADALKAMQSELNQLGARLLAGQNFSVDVSEGKPHKVIVERAKSLDVDLIIINAQKHGAVEKMVLGSVAMKVTERAKCSVLVLKA